MHDQAASRPGLKPGTDTARRVSAAGAAARRAQGARARLERAVEELVERAPELTPRQRDRIAAVFASATNRASS